MTQVSWKEILIGDLRRDDDTLVNNVIGLSNIGRYGAWAGGVNAAIVT
jgi:hypothetical protein